MSLVRHRLALVAAAAACVPAWATGLATAPAHAVDVEEVPASIETTPVLHSGDAADDPAIWVHPTDPSRSLVIANDKGPGDSPSELDTYDLSGNMIQRIDTPAGFWGNVDVRQGVGLPGVPSDVVAVARGDIQLYTVDPDSRMLQSIRDGSIAATGEGLCLYDSELTGRLYAFIITRSGLVRQVALTDADGDGRLAGSVVRSFQVGSEAEGCVADDETGALYVSQEDVALWRYGAEPSAGSTRVVVDQVVANGGNLTPDIEGLTLVDQGSGAGYLIASAQNGSMLSASSFAVYERSGGNDYVKSFRVTAGTAADDCDGTDGIAAHWGPLGPAFPTGLFVCQDNNNDAPGSSGRQNFKYVDLGSIVQPANRPPVPAFTHTCAELTCAFDGSGSSDPDGGPVEHDWSFGDGTGSDLVAPEHTFQAPGTYEVTLVVRDPAGASGSLVKEVTVRADTGDSLAYVAAASTNGNRVNHTVRVPSEVRAGDLLLLLLTSNSTTSTVTGPQGWTQLDAVDDGGMRARLWSRPAGAGDAGAAVVVTTSGYAKSDLTVSAYRSTSGSPTVATSAHRFFATPSALTTPEVTVPTAGGWLVSYWGAKSGGGAWTPPPNNPVRAESHGTGGGAVHALLTDSGQALPSGTAGGLTATLATPPGRAVTFSVVVAP